MNVINLSALPTKPLRRPGVVRFDPTTPPPPVGTGSTPVPLLSPSPVGTGSTPVHDPTPPRNPRSIPTALAPWLAQLQTRVLRSALRDEEGQWFADKLRELEQLIADMPHTYQTEHQSEDQKKVWLHYFAGGSANWYIIEKDKGTPGDTPAEFQSQMFGLADLFGDGGELGYISLPELLSVNAELDFHFTPCSLAELRAQRRRRQDDRDAAEQAAAQEFDPADETQSPLPAGEGQGEGERPAHPEDGTVKALLARGWAFENITPLPDASAPGAVPEPVIHTPTDPMNGTTPQFAPNETAVIHEGFLYVRLPLQTPTPSATGKTLVVASTHGNTSTTATVNGKPVIIGLNAYIKP